MNHHPYMLMRNATHVVREAHAAAERGRRLALALRDPEEKRSERRGRPLMAALGPVLLALLGAKTRTDGK